MYEFSCGPVHCNSALDKIVTIIKPLANEQMDYATQVYFLLWVTLFVLDWIATFSFLPRWLIATPLDHDVHTEDRRRQQLRRASAGGGTQRSARRREWIGSLHGTGSRPDSHFWLLIVYSIQQTDTEHSLQGTSPALLPSAFVCRSLVTIWIERGLSRRPLSTRTLKTIGAQLLSSITAILWRYASSS